MLEGSCKDNITMKVYRCLCFGTDFVANLIKKSTRSVFEVKMRLSRFLLLQIVLLFVCG